MLLDLIFILQIFAHSELPLISSLSSFGFSEGDVLMVEKYWSHWMDATESLLWLDTNVRSVLKGARMGRWFKWMMGVVKYIGTLHCIPIFRMKPCKINSVLYFFSVVSISGTWTSENITVPDGIMSLRAVALVMSDTLGLGFTPVPQKVTKYYLRASMLYISDASQI